MPEVSDAIFEIKVSAQKATMLIHGAAASAAPNPLTRDDLERKLAALKVVHGIDVEMLERIVADQLYNQTHIVAKASPPKEGRHAWVEQVIRSEVDSKPRLLENGMADYKNVDNIRQVTKDQVLAVKHPAVPGTPGTDILGHPIDPPPVRDVDIKPGTNTRVSEDGMKLLSDGQGFLHTLGGAICVGLEYVVRGDVDFATGNIKYQGNVRVRGNVTSGFKVEADGDIVVEGTVEAAEIISKEGHVRVMQGVFGQGKGIIRAPRGGVHLAFAQDLAVECAGLLEVEKGLRNCRVVAASIKADYPRCAIIGGTIKSYSDVSLFWVGADGCRTEIIVADRESEEARLKIPTVEARKRKAETQAAEFDKKFKEIAASAAQSGGKLSAEAQSMMNKLLAAYGPLKKSIAPMEDERKKLCDVANSPERKIGHVIFKDKVAPGSRLNMYGQVRELAEEDAKKEWRWAPDDLISLSLMSDDD
jgi:uncharacterized protein (DUF342 family)